MRLLRPLIVTLLLPGMFLSCTPVNLIAWRVSAPQTSAKVSDGHLQINGRGFFPLGFYHVSWAKGGTPEQRHKDLKLMADSGFNVILTEPIHDTLTEMLPLLEQASREHMLVMAHGIPPELVPRLADSPALLGFTVMDDSNYNSTPQEVEKLHALYKTLAPEKLTGITLAVAMGRPESGFFGTSDAVSNISYPVGGTDELGVVYSVMRLTVEQAAQKGVVPLASLQTFAWPGRRSPTAQELRNMTYQALMAGVKGVFFYAFRSGEQQLTVHSPLWREARQLAAEVRRLAPTLLDSTRTELMTTP